jgi:hypothetical protein
MDITTDREKRCLIALISIICLLAASAFIFFEIGSQVVQHIQTQEDTWKRGTCNITMCALINRTICSPSQYGSDICSVYIITLFLPFLVADRNCFNNRNTSFSGNTTLRSTRNESELRNSEVDCWYSCANISGTLIIDHDRVPRYSYFLGNAFLKVSLVCFASVFVVPCLAFAATYCVRATHSPETTPLNRAVEPM